MVWWKMLASQNMLQTPKPEFGQTHSGVELRNTKTI